MRTFPGRSQRLTRSHSCRLRDKGVDLKRRPPKSRPAAPLEDTGLHRGGGPQGLRRPRFSFFRFTCQTARDQGGPALRWAREPSKPRASDHDREPSHRLSVRSFEDAPPHRGGGVPNWVYIGVRGVKCQHPEGAKTHPAGAIRQQPCS